MDLTVLTILTHIPLVVAVATVEVACGVNIVNGDFYVVLLAM